jgi:cobalt-zinc-cadmium resistance protein CzcA
MIERILAFSIRWRVLVIVIAVILVAAGLYAATRLPIDAVPDITSNQVQINTVAPAFAPLEMEQYVTFPIEVAMSSVPRKEEIRSISQFGLSQVTITFADDVDVYWARQLVLERLREVERELPAGVVPELSPVSTGLGEIYSAATCSRCCIVPVTRRGTSSFTTAPPSSPMSATCCLPARSAAPTCRAAITPR